MKTNYLFGSMVFPVAMSVFGCSSAASDSPSDEAVEALASTRTYCPGLDTIEVDGATNCTVDGVGGIVVKRSRYALFNHGFSSATEPCVVVSRPHQAKAELSDAFLKSKTSWFGSDADILKRSNVRPGDNDAPATLHAARDSEKSLYASSEPVGSRDWNAADIYGLVSLTVPQNAFDAARETTGTFKDFNGGTHVVSCKASAFRSPPVHLQ